MTISPPEAAVRELVTTSTGRWTLDPDTSEARITHPTMWGLIKVKGRFGTMRGDGRVGDDGAIEGKVQVDAASVDTGNKKRDNHLRSDDFFNVTVYPDITFEARSARPDGAGLVVDGALTVTGVTRSVQVPVIVEGAGTDSVTLKAEFDVDRADHDMTFNKLGALSGRASVQVTARFVRSGGPSA